MNPVVAEATRPHKTRFKKKEEDELVQRMVAMQARFGEVHPATLDTMSQLATLYVDQWRLKVAGDLRQRVAKAWQRTFGEDDPRTLMSLSQYADVVYRQGQLIAALQLHRGIFAKATQILHPTQGIMLNIKRNLAVCLRDTNHLLEAELLLREAIRDGGNGLRRDDAILVDAWWGLANVLYQRGTHEESLTIPQTLLETVRTSRQYDTFQLRLSSLIGKI